MISYSQNFEDVLLERVFREVPSGFYVDVGAHDPEFLSITRHFYGRGWSGINIEPGLIFEKLKSKRVRDINLNLAVSNFTGEVTFYEAPGADGLASLTPDLPEAVRALCTQKIPRKVHCCTLTGILAEYSTGKTIDFLTIDVEGHERQVLEGNDWKRFRPRIVIVEATLPFTPTPCHEQWEPILLGSDYSFAYFDGLNRYYVRGEDRALMEHFSVPPNVFDDFIPAEVHSLTERVVSLEKHVNDLTVHRQHIAEKWREAEYRLADVVADRDALLAGTGGRSLKIGLWLARRIAALGHLFRKRRTVEEVTIQQWRMDDVLRRRSASLRIEGSSTEGSSKLLEEIA